MPRKRPYKLFAAWSNDRVSGMELVSSFTREVTAKNRAKALLDSSRFVRGICIRTMIMDAETEKVVYDSAEQTKKDKTEQELLIEKNKERSCD